MLEGYSTLTYLAALTERVKLGTLVTGVTYRHPGVLAKTVTTLDVLSGGRAYLGIGAAWFDREHHGLGVPFPPLGERFERLEETLRIVKQFWSGEARPFEGRHYRLAETLNSPPALARPHPPILIGGQGEKKTLRLVARYADACNLFAFGDDATLAAKLDVLRRHCDAEGRPYEAIEKTTLGLANLPKQSPAEIVAQCRRLAALGVQHAIFSFARVDELTGLRAFGKDVIPAVAEL
jgi:F420-dependent oxidoreductase-like protein